MNSLARIGVVTLALGLFAHACGPGDFDDGVARPDAARDGRGADAVAPNSTDAVATEDTAHAPDAPVPDDTAHTTPDAGSPPHPFGPRDASTAPPPPLSDGGTSAWPSPPPAPTRLAPGTWLRVRAGSFVMGVIPSDECYRTTNETRHPVTLTRDFELMSTEVTQGHYREVMGFNPSHATSCGDQCPADLIDWHRAAAYANAASARAGLPLCYACTNTGATYRCTDVDRARGRGIYECPGYRLPTEAEWEFAYRAGTTTHVHSGSLSTCFENDPALGRIAWFLRNSDVRSHPVAGLDANAWGFFDMSGNVWEWTHDTYLTDLGTSSITDPAPEGDATLRVMRGGSFNCLPFENRASHRSGLPSEISGSNVGFRLARTLFAR